ncbi:TPA: type II toxin-antitoxin system VapC family toxin [Candidatus Woesearchaeota archaeon]|nr:type II toxin-antitoxin system VapC family toxin [Candidatus Woesearchaeota archaeon]
MAKYLIDSSAWIEYLAGSKRAEPLKKYFEEGELFTSPVCVAEIIAKVAKEGLSVENAKNSIHTHSSIFAFDFNTAVDAGTTYAELRKIKPKIALSDAITIVLARNIKAKILTFDNDFRNIQEAIVF